MLEHATLQYVETKCLKCGAKITIPQVIDDEKYVEEMMTQTLKNYQQLMDEAKKEFPYYADLIVDIDNPQWKDMKGNWHDGFWSEVVIKWFKEQFGE